MGQLKPDAHPLLAEQFKTWRDIAEEVCPGGVGALARVGSDVEGLPGSLKGAMMAVTESAALASVSDAVVAVSTTW